MMAVQVAITLVGHLEVIKDSDSTPLIELDANGLRHCKRDILATAFSQGYVVLLLLFGFIFGMYNRNISRNHNEVVIFVVNYLISSLFNQIHFILSDTSMNPSTISSVSWLPPHTHTPLCICLINRIPFILSTWLKLLEILSIIYFPIHLFFKTHSPSTHFLSILLVPNAP